jgi:hypothetical protein
VWIFFCDTPPEQNTHTFVCGHGQPNKASLHKNNEYNNANYLKSFGGRLVATKKFHEKMEMEENGCRSFYPINVTCREKVITHGRPWNGLLCCAITI